MTSEHCQRILKSAVFGLSSSLSPLVGGGRGLVCESVGKADLLSDHFDGKQSRESVDLPLTCRPSPCLTSFAFRSSEVRRLLLDLDPYGGSDPLGIIIIIKRGWQCKAGRERLTPYQSEDPNPRTSTHRKKEEKGKTVGDKK